MNDSRLWRELNRPFNPMLEEPQPWRWWRWSLSPIQITHIAVIGVFAGIGGGSVLWFFIGACVWTAVALVGRNFPIGHDEPD